MPFTPSHAVVALPFVRTPLLSAAVAVGAMTPDLPLFLRATPISYQTTHTNLVLSTVLAGMLLALWYLLLRPAVRELAPDALARRLPPEWDATGARVWQQVQTPRAGARGAGWRRPAVVALTVLVSLALGVVTHVVWDAFTHEGRWGVRLVPALGERWGPLAGYTWMQHGSSVAGLAVLAVFAARRLSRRTPAASLDRVLPAAVRRAWWLSLPVILVAAWVLGLALFGPITAERTPQQLAYRVLPPAAAVWGALTIALCVVVLVARGRRFPRSGEASR